MGSPTAGAIEYGELAERWDAWRVGFNRAFMKFSEDGKPLVTLRPSDIAYTTLLGRLATARRALSEVEIEKRRVEAEHAEMKALLVRAIMRNDPDYLDAKNDTARRVVLDLRLDADDYGATHPLSGSALRVGYRQTKQRLAAIRDEECRLSTELTIIRDERRTFEVLVDYHAGADERYEQQDKGSPDAI